MTMTVDKALRKRLRSQFPALQGNTIFLENAHGPDYTGALQGHILRNPIVEGRVDVGDVGSTIRGEFTVKGKKDWPGLATFCPTTATITTVSAMLTITVALACRAISPVSMVTVCSPN